MKRIVFGLLAAAVIGLATTPAMARHARVAVYPAPYYGVYRVYSPRVYYPRRAYYPIYPAYPVYPVYPAVVY